MEVNATISAYAAANYGYTTHYDVSNNFVIVHKRPRISSIFDAAKYGNEEILRKFIQLYPQDINAREPEYNQTPLLVAVDIGNYTLSKILLANGSDVNVADIYGLTALHTAVSNRSPHLVKLLLDYGADVNPSQRFRGMTPLYMAVEYDLRSTVKMLLRKGASIEDATVEDKNVLDVAMMMGHPMRRLLRYYVVQQALENNRRLVVNYIDPRWSPELKPSCP